MMFHGTGNIFITQSSSRMGMYHYTVIGEEGQANCTCEGWRTHKRCWHVEEGLTRAGWQGDGVDFQVNL